MNVTSASLARAVKRDKDTADNAVEYVRASRIREQVFYCLVVASGLLFSGVVTALAFYGHGLPALPLGDVFAFGMAALGVPLDRSQVIYEYLSGPGAIFYILTVILPFAGIVITEVYQYFESEEVFSDGDSEVCRLHSSMSSVFSHLTSNRTQDAVSLSAEDESQVDASKTVDKEGVVASEPTANEEVIVLETSGSVRLRQVRPTTSVFLCSLLSFPYPVSRSALCPSSRWG